MINCWCVRAFYPSEQAEFTTCTVFAFWNRATKNKWLHFVICQSVVQTRHERKKSSNLRFHSRFRARLFTPRFCQTKRAWCIKYNIIAHNQNLPWHVWMKGLILMGLLPFVSSGLCIICMESSLHIHASFAIITTGTIHLLEMLVCENKSTVGLKLANLWSPTLLCH